MKYVIMIISVDCNMKDNAGQIVEIQPAQSTCNLCPATVSPRLNHPPYLCTFPAANGRLPGVCITEDPRVSTPLGI